MPIANCPNLKIELFHAIMEALDARKLMSMQALNLPSAQDEMKDILLNHAGLYETLSVLDRRYNQAS